MADKLFSNHVGFPETYVDMGDGTWAKRVALAATPTIDIGEVSQVPASTGTVASVASSATAVTLQAANASRQMWTVYNDSTAVLYLILSATTPTTSTYTVQIAAGGYYELPYRYTGIIQGIWASANGNARVTEIV
jgi:hypothetical protein